MPSYISTILFGDQVGQEVPSGLGQRRDRGTLIDAGARHETQYPLHHNDKRMPVWLDMS